MATVHSALLVLLLVAQAGNEAPLGIVSTPAAQPESAMLKPARPRARDIGLVIGVLPPGPLNAITDVEGVRVGHCTMIDGGDVRTGVTAILPHGGNIFQQKVPAALCVGNGFGKLIGATQLEELGTLETPIVLTNTLSAFMAADAVVDHVLQHPGNEFVTSVNPVVGETNDGFLNDIRGRHVRREHVLRAIDVSRTGPVEEGSVGAGTGTCCFGWKGGIGTASRRLPERHGGYTLGVLVQSNFTGVLTINGVRVSKELGRFDAETLYDRVPEPGGSCMIVVATDAPLDTRQLGRLARRALLGLAAVGSPMRHGSGDYVLAFSTHEGVRVPHTANGRPQVKTVLRDEALSTLFQAAREATEEAILNSLLRATTVTGFQGHTCEALPVERVVEIGRRYGAIGP
jgi:D-aminopeptidase